MGAEVPEDDSIRQTLVAARDRYRDCLTRLASELLDGAVAADSLSYEEALAVVAQWGVVPAPTFAQMSAIWTHLYLLLRSADATEEEAQEAHDNVALLLPALEGMIAVLRRSGRPEPPPSPSTLPVSLHEPDPTPPGDHPAPPQ